MKKNVWIFCHHTSPPEFGHFTRHYNLGIHLKKQGYNPIIFVGSVPHNSEIQLIEGKEKFTIYNKHTFPYIFIKTCLYNGSGKRRLVAMMQYYFGLFNTYKKLLKNNYERPDVIIASSVHPLTCVAGIKIAKKLKVPCIVEIKDLWPESIVSYSKKLAKKHPVIKILYKLEKWIYKKADRLIFTMEGGAEYIIDQGWDKDIDMTKIHHINNGVDLEVFDYNKETFKIEDEDLSNENIFKIVYTGSIRRVNNLGLILDASKSIEDDKIKFLIWGAGDEVEALKQRLLDESISNVVLKGSVDKKFIPYILSNANVNLSHYSFDEDINKYGTSRNKLFEYLASGKPIISTESDAYDVIKQNFCGYSYQCKNTDDFLALINRIMNTDSETIKTMSNNSRKTAEQFDFKVLTEKLIDIIEDM